MFSIPEGKKLILFDGICNLCNNSVLRVIKLDTKNQFVFTSLQSNIGKKITNHLNINTSKVDAIILYEPSVSYHIKSSAALKIMNAFGGFWKITQVFWIFPKSIRNRVYDFIAKNRYRWFGKKESCIILTDKLKVKFLD